MGVWNYLFMGLVIHEGQHQSLISPIGLNLPTLKYNNKTILIKCYFWRGVSVYQIRWYLENVPNGEKGKGGGGVICFGVFLGLLYKIGIEQGSQRGHWKPLGIYFKTTWRPLGSQWEQEVKLSIDLCVIIIPDICHFFYTHTFWVLEILHSESA